MQVIFSASRTGVVVATLLALSGASAFADDSVNCEAYAVDAVAANQKNKEMHCGLTGGRFSDNYVGHLNWCKRADVKMENLTDESKARAAALDLCSQQNTLRCSLYADMAVADAKTNQKRGCGYTESHFADDREGHFNWCMTASPADVAAASDYRIKGIKACEAKGACQFVAVATEGIYERYNQACTGLDHPNAIPGLDVLSYSQSTVMADCQAIGVEASEKKLDLINEAIAVCEALSD